MLSCKCSETALFMKVAYISCSDRTTLIRTISGCFCKEQNPDHFRLQRYWIFKSGLQSVRRNRRQITHFHFQVPGQLKCFNLDSLGGWWDHQWEFSDTFIKCWNEKKKKRKKNSVQKDTFLFLWSNLFTDVYISWLQCYLDNRQMYANMYSSWICFKRWMVRAPRLPDVWLSPSKWLPSLHKQCDWRLS